MLNKYANAREIFYLALLFICIIPWIIFQIDIVIPGDVAFLFSGAKMLLEGKMMSEYFYDDNPPMSFLIYEPAVFLHLLGASKHIAIQLYIMSFTLLSVLITYYFLGKWKTLSITPKFIFLSCYICAITLIPYNEYGQKDHLIEIALVPFLLMQISITKKHNVPSYIYWITSILYVPFILLKPHFGLLPTLVILHRLYLDKSISALLKADFISLAVGTVSYIAFIFLITPDFIEEVLPSSLLYYVGGKPYTDIFYTTSFTLTILTGSLIIISALNDKTTEAKRIALIFSVMALISIIPFFVQGKGFSVHLLPTICLILISFGTTLHLYIKDKFVNISNKPSIFIILICALSYLHPALGRHSQTTDEFQELSFAKLIKEEAGNEAFFIEAYTTNIFATATLYNKNKFASRFPSLWFIAEISRMPAEQQQKSWDKFSILITEDFKRYAPKMVAFGTPDEDGYSLLSLLNSNEEFRKIFSNNYQYKKQYKLLKTEYPNFLRRGDPNENIYDIYIRND